MEKAENCISYLKRVMNHVMNTWRNLTVSRRSLRLRTYDVHQ